MRHLAWFLIPLLACSPAPSPGDGGTECKGVPARTLEQLFPAYFDAAAPTGCVTGCHAVGIGGLKFSTAAELWQATNGTSSTTGDGPLVTPFSPARSWLFQKLLPSSASPMPQGGTLLTEPQLAEVEGWICAGAPGPGGTGGGGGGAVSVTSLSPASGYVGTRVTISGAGFSPTPSQNTIQFNGAATPALTASSTALTANVPASASTGPVSVQVGTKSAASPASFTLLIGNPVPVIAALTPCGKVAGAASFSLTVSGMNFLPGSTLSFNGQSLAITNPAPGGGPSSPSVFGVASAAVTLAGAVQPLFTANCATAGCHTAAARAGSLELTAATSRTNLVGAMSAVCVGRPLVADCNPTRAGSVLIDKILATPQLPACAGTPMPKGAPLTAIEKQKILDWVAQGAPGALGSRTSNNAPAACWRLVNPSLVIPSPWRRRGGAPSGQPCPLAASTAGTPFGGRHPSPQLQHRCRRQSTVALASSPRFTSRRRSCDHRTQPKTSLTKEFHHAEALQRPSGRTRCARASSGSRVHALRSVPDLDRNLNRLRRGIFDDCEALP